MSARRVAGASAQAEFERRSRRYKEKRRAALPRTGLLVACVSGLVFVACVLTLGRVGIEMRDRVALSLALAVLAAGRLAKDAWGIRPSTRAWAIGAHGERETGRILDRLRAFGYHVIHDVRVPGSLANIDHVVIGSTGIFLIETKSYSGTVRLSGDSLRHNGRNLTRVFEQIERQRSALLGLLSPVPEHLRVQPILCFHRTRIARPLFGSPRLNGLRVSSSSTVMRTIRSGVRVLSTEEVTQLAGRLVRPSEG